MVFEFQTIFQLLLAVVLGGSLGLEREYKKREAGLRTYTLVCLGATLFSLLSFEFRGLGDPSRVIPAIAIGMGFLGAGVIIYRTKHIEGLTTAAGLWLVAAIGIAIGLSLYFMAIFATLVGIGVLAGLRLVEEEIIGTKD